MTLIASALEGRKESVINPLNPLQKELNEVKV